MSSNDTPTDPHVQSAKDALSAIFGDTSVPREITRERLLEVREEIEILIDCLREG